MKKSKKSLSTHWFRKILLSVILLFFSMLCVNATVVQLDNNTIKVSENNVNLNEFIWKLKKITGYEFVCDSDDLEEYDSISINMTGSLEEILSEVLKNTDLTFYSEDKIYVILKRDYPVKQSVQKEKKLVRGKVTDKDGMPLPGVSVVIKGTSTGVATGVNGDYNIEIEGDNAILIFSFVGLLPENVDYSGQEEINVVLYDDMESLKEVVVTGYQTISKERATGSFSVINADDLDKQIDDNLVGKLQGLLPGVKVDNDNNILIRGQGTLYGDTKPLIVVDGFPLEGDLSSINPNDVENITVLKDAASASIWGAKAGNGVVVLVTKHGKPAQKAKIVSSYSLTIGERPKFKDYHLMNTSDQVDMVLDRLDAGWNSNYHSNFIVRYDKVQEAYFDKNLFGLSDSEFNERIEKLRSYDAYKQFEEELFRNSMKSQLNLSVSGGSEKMRFYNSLLYVNDKKESKGNGSSKLVLYTKFNYDLGKNAKLFSNVSVEYGRSTNNGIDITDLVESDGFDYNSKAFEPIYDDNGDQIKYYNSPADKWKAQDLESKGYLPYSSSFAEYREFNDKTNSMLSARAQLGLNVKLTKDITFDTKYQYESRFTKGRNYLSPQHPDRRFFINAYTVYEKACEHEEPCDDPEKMVRHIPLSGELITENSTLYSWSFRNQLNFNKHMTDHRIAAIAGFEINRRFYKTEKARNFAYNDESLTSPKIDLASLQQREIPNWFGYYKYNFDQFKYKEVDDRNVSMYVNGSYTYKDKYTLSVSGRIDQSNLFGSSSDFRYNPIWSAGLSWNVGNESFFDVEAFNMLKLRVTHGINGNTNKSFYPVLTGRSFNHYFTSVDYIRLISPANDELKWENNITTNIGLDFDMFNHKINGSIDVYRKKSVDVIGPKAINPTLGFSTANINFASIMNKGIELNLNFKLIDTGDFKWDSYLNFSYNKNEVVDVSPLLTNTNNYLEPPVGGNYGEPIPGKPIGRVYAYKWAGVDNEGVGQIYDSNGEKISIGLLPDDPDLVSYQGTMNAPYFGQVSNTLSYKNLTLTTMFNYQFGNVMVMPKGKVSGDYFSTELSDRWRKPGDELSTTTPGLFKGKSNWYQSRYYDPYWVQSDINIESAAYIKLKDIILDYKVESKLLEKLKIEDFSIKLQLKNMWMWTKNSMNIDPERVNSNILPLKFYNTPTKVQPRMVILGIKANL